jgi:DNA-binding LacI/PurR family transcriptional regulator
MVTINEIAAKAKVSRTLVSRVLNGKSGVSPSNRKKILSIISELNYRPNALARSLVLQKTKTIGIVIDTICVPYYFDLIYGFQKAGEDSGYNVIFCSGNSDEVTKSKYINFFTNGTTDGVIIFGSYLDDTKLIKELAVSDFPFVLIENDIHDLKINSVLVDNFKGAYKATSHLIDLGYKNIFHFTGDMNSQVSLTRLNGFVQAMHDFSIPINIGNIVYADFESNSGYTQMKNLISNNILPEAIFFGGDATAFGAINAMHEAKLSTPKDIAIIGFDDDKPQDNVMIYPKLTTIRQPLYEIGIESIKLLIEKINNPKMEPKKIIFDPELIIRETCK